jgi:hypothetical protein
MPINGSGKSISNLSYILLSGTATSGSTTTLTDTAKNLEADLLNSRMIKITKSGVDYYRTITDNNSNSITFNALEAPVASSVIVGAGDETEGQITINCKTAGADGNKYSVALVAGTGISAVMKASIIDDVLIIESPTDGEGTPLPIMAGNVQGVVQADERANATFDVSGTFVAGNLPLVEPIPFTGGDDGVSAEVGDMYEVLDSVIVPIV